MSFTYGFYNSVNHDRVYDAVQLSQLFDGLIADGVYETQGDKFAVTAGSGMTVTVGSGRAWFNHTWSYNDSLHPVQIEDSDFILDRIDAIVLETNINSDVRKNTIKVLKGIPDENPVKPTMTHTLDVNQYPLAYVTVPHGALEITQAEIENAVGTSATPFVTGIIEVMDIDMLVAQWTTQWNQYITTRMDDFDTWVAAQKAEYIAWVSGFENVRETEFLTWFNNLRNQLDTNQAAHLQNEIDYLNQREFNHYYGTMNKSVHFNTNSSGETTSIVETTDEAVATTTFAENLDVTTITCVLVPTEGPFKYIKTVVIDGDDITQTFTREMKEGE